VLLYVTIQQMLAPLRFVPSFSVPGPARLLLRGFARGLWFLLYPLRLLFPPLGRAVRAGVVSVGEPLEAFGERHEDILKVFFTGLAIVYILGLVGFLLVISLLASWFWTLISIGSVTVGSMALYGFFKSGAAGLLWGAAVAAKHGVCPPVTIVRGP
jgi:hypothetical protein